MFKTPNVLLFCLLALTGCYEIPSTDELNNDLVNIDVQIEETEKAINSYSGGLLQKMAQVRLEVLKSTKTMLEQKKIGFNRYIQISYSISGNKFSPPTNKDELLIELNKDIKGLKDDLSNAQEESARYGGGLLRLTSLMNVATVSNSIALVEQSRLLLKHDIPYFSYAVKTIKKEKVDVDKVSDEDLNSL